MEQIFSYISFALIYKQVSPIYFSRDGSITKSFRAIHKIIVASTGGSSCW